MKESFKPFAVIAGTIAIVLMAVAATQVLPGKRISQYPNNSNPADGDYLVTERGDGSTNNNVTIAQLRFRYTNGLATTGYVNSTETVVSNGIITFVSGFTNQLLEVQTNGVRVGLVTNVNFVGSSATGMLSGLTAVIGAGSGGAQTGTTNFLNLSVQAAKLPTTNYPGIDAGWQDWELIYYKTNAEGTNFPISASWQCIVPADYATNSLKIRIYSLLLSTNGPNSSNTIFRVSCLAATPDAPSNQAKDLHTNTFSSQISGTNTWGADATGTNKIQSVVITPGTNWTVLPGDLLILNLDRNATNDTFGGATSVVGLQLEYTRP